MNKGGGSAQALVATVSKILIECHDVSVVAAAETPPARRASPLILTLACVMITQVTLAAAEWNGPLGQMASVLTIVSIVITYSHGDTTIVLQALYCLKELLTRAHIDLDMHAWH